MKCKGVKGCVVKKYLTFQKYKNILFNEEATNEGVVSQNVIRSYGHQLFSESVTKVALSPNDDKVYICDDKINTLTFGSCHIPF
jgi:hypothetical protein